MRWIAYHRWSLSVAAVTILVGSQMFSPIEPAPLWFFLAWLVPFMAAATLDHRRHLREIAEGRAS